MYHKDGGTTGEFNLNWVDITDTCPAIELKVYNDSFSALKQFDDLLCFLEERDDDISLTPEDVIDFLKANNVTDLTQRRVS